MTTEQFNKAQEVQEHIQNLKEVQKFITSVSGEYKLAIQSGRKCFPINEPGIQDKVRDYINQRNKRTRGGVQGSMTITFQPNMLEDPKFKALITNKEMLSIYRPCPEAHTENITFFYDKRNGKILTRVIYSFESYQVCQATKEKLNSGHKHPDIFRIDQERNLLTVYYSKL